MGMTTTKKPRHQPPVHRPARAQSSPTRHAAALSPPVQSLSALQRRANQSPVVQRLHDLAPLQRMDDEELMQGKLIQRMDEEELMQGKLIQRMEEEELQMKTVQRMEEDELQGKMIQRKAPPKANNTGLPDNLKSGIENLSGMSMDHVKVHRNSDKPATVQAHAYAQGSDIHLAPGQEQHLPHEAWHVVQQAQGRVKPTMQMKGVAVNDDAGLEKEADVMGAKALQRGGNVPDSRLVAAAALSDFAIVQRMPEDQARTVRVTYNSWYHVGHHPVENEQDAIDLTAERIQTGWNGAQNHVLVDFNARNLEETLFDKLLNNEFIDSPALPYYIVQLPDQNYYIVNRAGNASAGGGQISMRVDKGNMNAYHIDFY